MSKRTFLAPYTVRIKLKKETDELKLQDAVNGKPLFQFLNEMFIRLKSDLHSENRINRTFKIEELYLDKEQKMLYGIVKTGEFGNRSELINTRSGIKEFEKERYHADVIPFYFFFYLPDDKNQGFAIFEKYGHSSPKTAFEDIIRSELKKVTESVTFSLNPLVPEKLIKRYLDKGKVTKVILRKKEIPADKFDSYTDANKGAKKIEGHVDMVFVAKRGTSFNLKKSLNSFLDNKKNRLIEIEEFVEDEVIVSVKIGEKTTRTVNLSKPELKMRAYIDITDDAEKQKDDSERLAYESVHFKAIELLNDILETMYLRGTYETIQQNQFPGNL
ncbi:MAG TPA: hypothetical protein ENJ29_02515 [Bacteroidetes bacterium]|nr:hypothetical protein [Bacteroidota bacterium]